MKRKLLILFAASAIGLLLTVVFLHGVLAQGIYIQLNNQPGGDIDQGSPSEWDGSYENTRGAMIWNGTEWVINNTWAHSYFTNIPTGTLVIAHATTANYDGSGAAGVQVVQGYTLTQSTYSYTLAGPAVNERYRYEAVVYRIRQPDGKQILLQSRGCGLGASQAYFDIYIQDPAGGNGVTAIRGDRALHFAGMIVDQAALEAGAPGDVFAHLPTTAPVERARYWFDLNNGSDMGGDTYFFRTKSLDCRTGALGAAFPAMFQLQKYFNSDGMVYDFNFTPALLSEIHFYAIYLPLVKK